MNAASNNGDPVIEIFHVVAVDPVDDVEASIETKSKEVMRGDGLCLPCL